jgi:hypothetical protein
MSLDVYYNDEVQFKALVNFGAWRVAVNNGGPEHNKPVTISSLSRHRETDEVFALLKGGCALVTGGDGEKPEKPEVTWMEPGKVYNVTRGTWHSNRLLPGASIIIMENRDTGPDNSDDYPLGEALTL